MDTRPEFPRAACAGLPAGRNGELSSEGARSAFVRRDGRIAGGAPRSAACLRSTTLAVGETRFWAPVERLLDELPPLVSQGHRCETYVANIGVTNQLFLAGYLQGFVGECILLIRRQLEESAKLDCPCARMCEVPTLVNWARLERSRVNPSGLWEVLAKLERTVQLLKTINADELPPQLAEPRATGAIFKDAQSAGETEPAKYFWLAGDVPACLRALGEAGTQSASALELRIRCLLEQGRLGEVLEICVSQSGKHVWALDYAAITLLIGRREAEALQLAARLGGHFPLPRLRLVLELLERGYRCEALMLVRTLAAMALRIPEEPTILIAAAMLAEAGIALPPELGEASRIASQSRHFPSVFLASPLLGVTADRGRMRRGLADLRSRAALFREEIAKHG